MKAFVLAGGYGTRLYPFSEIIPKCLLPIAGKPCCYRIAEKMIKQGFEVIILINKWAETHFKFEFRDLPVTFSVSPEPQGTVGELLNARSLIDSTFALQYGDDLTEVDYNALIKFHVSNRAFATLAVTTMYRLPVGVIEADEDGRVVAFVEKPYLGKPSWTATAIFELEALSYFKVGEDVSSHTLPKMLADGARVFAFRVNYPWYDVGDISAWHRANEYYRDKNI